MQLIENHCFSIQSTYRKAIELYDAFILDLNNENGVP